MLKEFFERRRIKKVFSKVASRNVVEALMKDLGEPLTARQRTGVLERRDGCV